MRCPCTIHARRVALVALVGLALAATAAAQPLRPFGAFGSDDVLLVVAPHPDDESLCCAGAIARARAAGARVTLVWVTSGDAFELDAHVIERRLFTGARNLLELAAIRMQEGGRAAELLGIASDERVFLGYPDRGLTQLLHENFDTPYRSPHTGAAAVPYAQALAPGSAYTGRNLERDLKAVIARVKPTWVLAPTPLDTHPDHRASGELVLRVMGTFPQASRVRYWIVHGGFEWPRPRGLHADAPLSVPRRARALPWIDLPLTDAERALKESAIRRYQSQLRLTQSFMLSFVKRNEIYSAAPLVSALPAAQNTAVAADLEEVLLTDLLSH